MAIARLQQLFTQIFLCFSVITLVACGGGGGGGKKKDTTPNTFAFTAVQNASVSSQVESASITVAGINAAAAITITGGEYAIGSGAFTAAAGTVENGQTVKVRVTTPPNTSQSVSATVTIGGISTDFTVMTIATDVTPDQFSFAPVVDEAVNTQIESDPITVAGINNPVAISVTGGEYAIGNGAFTATAATIENGQTVKVRLTTSANTNTPVEAVLTIGGVSATFTVTTIADTTPDAFSFEPNSISDVAPNSAHTSSPITVAGIDIPVAISIANGEYAIGESEYTATAGTVSNGQIITVRVTAPNATDATHTATLTIGGVTADFSVTTYPDEVAPTANIAFPPPMTATEDNNVIIRGTAQDDFNEIASLTITVNGNLVPEEDVTSDDGFATWQADIPLTAGVNTLVVSTTDTQNNTNPSAAQVVVTQQDFDLAFPNNDVDIDWITAMALDKANNRIFVMNQFDWSMVAIDLATGQRSIFSSPTFPNNQNVISGSNAVVIDAQRNRALVGGDLTGGGYAIYEVAIDDENAGARTILSTINTQPLIQYPRGIVLDPTNSEVAYVLGEISQNLARMNILTGERTLVSDNTMPDSGDLFDVPLDMEIDATGQHAWVVEQNSRPLLRVDLTTGIRTSINMNGYPDTGFNYRLWSIVGNMSRSTLWAVDLVAGLVAYDVENEAWSLVWEFPRNTTFGNSLRGHIDLDEGNNYLVFADETTAGVYAVDVETSEMVIISKMLAD